MEILIASFLYLVVVKAVAHLLRSEVNAALEGLDRSEEGPSMPGIEEIQLGQLKELRDFAREASSSRVTRTG